jgi:hypothetical protein
LHAAHEGAGLHVVNQLVQPRRQAGEH